jgi:hypothetical protein
MASIVASTKPVNGTAVGHHTLGNGRGAQPLNKRQCLSSECQSYAGVEKLAEGSLSLLLFAAEMVVGAIVPMFVSATESCGRAAPCRSRDQDWCRSG